MITPGGIDDNKIIRKNSPRAQAGQGKSGPLKKTNILYIQYIQYSGAGADRLRRPLAPKREV